MHFFSLKFNSRVLCCATRKNNRMHKKIHQINCNPFKSISKIVRYSSVCNNHSFVFASPVKSNTHAKVDLQINVNTQLIQYIPKTDIVTNEAILYMYMYTYMCTNKTQLTKPSYTVNYFMASQYGATFNIYADFFLIRQLPLFLWKS